MANFLTDNADILFHLEHTDLPRIAHAMEDSYADAEQFDYAPVDADEAIEIGSSDLLDAVTSYAHPADSLSIYIFTPDSA